MAAGFLDRVVPERESVHGATLDGARAERAERISFDDDVAVVRSLRLRIGVFNVHHRLQFMYGDAYRARIDSTVGVGTRFVLALPAVRQQVMPTDKEDTTL